MVLFIRVDLAWFRYQFPKTGWAIQWRVRHSVSAGIHLDPCQTRPFFSPTDGLKRSFSDKSDFLRWKAITMYIRPCLRPDERQLVRCKPHAIAVFLVYLSSSSREFPRRKPVSVRDYGCPSVPRARVGAKRMKKEIVKRSYDAESQWL